MDGTFRTCPDVFCQVYTIHALEQGRVLLCVHALLTNKTQPNYQHIFEMVKRLVDGSAPATLLMDFEHAALIVAAVVFPDTIVKGCLYIYYEDDNIAIHARMIHPLLLFLQTRQRPCWTYLLMNYQNNLAL